MYVMQPAAATQLTLIKHSTALHATQMIAMVATRPKAKEGGA